MSARAASSSSTTEHRFPWKWRLADLEPPQAGAPTVFSTFACGGGSSMGYKLAGYDVVGNCEIDPRIADVYKANLHPRRSYVMDLRDFNRIGDLPEELFALDVLDGSPPCSTFSTSGDREKAWGKEKRFAEGQALQTLDDLFFVFLDTVEKLRPKVVVAENVTGLLKGNARGYVNEILKRFRGLGYDVQLFQLDASLMGVPQARQRVFFAANRIGAPKLRLDFAESPVTFGEVREERGKPIESAETRLLVASAVRHGERDLRDASERRRGKDSRFSERIEYDGIPASTVCANAQHYRACDGLGMTSGDIRNVTTFPQDYDFKGRSVQFICGMCVPPVMMANIASEIRGQWLDK